jgi:hypothetical protein
MIKMLAIPTLPRHYHPFRKILKIPAAIHFKEGKSDEE